MYPETTARADAYRATDYVAGGVVIAIDARSAGLDRLLARHRARTGVFITACNPHGRPSGATVNARRMARLAASLRARRCRVLAGLGAARSGDWVPEPSLLVFAASARHGARLGRAWRQNAVVTVARGQAARLLGLR